MKNKLTVATCLILIIALLSACGSVGNDLNCETKGATSITAQANKDVYESLDFNDKSEFDNATDGLVVAPDSLELYDSQGNVVFSQSAYSFITDTTPSPDSVNPSLWNNAQMNHYYGLFEVTPGIFQVRGYDVTNMTFVQSDNGWIIIDPMSNVECAKAALQLINSKIGERPVNAIIYTSANENCYGGVKGIISEFDATQRNIPIIAPEGFMNEITQNNLYTGNSSSREEEYINGTNLPTDETGRVDPGETPQSSTGTVSFIAPNTYIQNSLDEITIDGITMSFQLPPNGSDNLSMNIYFDKYNTLWMSDNVSSSLQGLYGLTDGNITDGNTYANFIKDTISYYGDNVQNLIQAYNWPHFTNSDINDYLLNTASAYKYVHDQTINYMNQGKNIDEIASTLSLPDKLNNCWYLRQYIAPLSQSIVATYNEYSGYYDGNPINLNPLSFDEEAQKLVEYMGGDTDDILEMALEDYDNGEYQWVAQITNVILSVEPNNQKAKYLCADALEQLGYQAESSVYRNAYLTGAQELRQGVDLDVVRNNTSNESLRDYMSTEQILNLLGTMINPSAAGELDISINLNIVDTNEQYLVTIKNGVLMYYKDKISKSPTATLTMNKSALFTLVDKDINQAKNIITVGGDSNILNTLNGILVDYNPSYQMVG